MVRVRGRQRALASRVEFGRCCERLGCCLPGAVSRKLAQPFSYRFGMECGGDGARRKTGRASPGRALGAEIHIGKRDVLFLGLVPSLQRGVEVDLKLPEEHGRDVVPPLLSAEQLVRTDPRRCLEMDSGGFLLEATALRRRAF